MQPGMHWRVIMLRGLRIGSCSLGGALVCLITPRFAGSFVQPCGWHEASLSYLRGVGVPWRANLTFIIGALVRNIRLRWEEKKKNKTLINQLEFSPTFTSAPPSFLPSLLTTYNT